ncbi:MAG TPA: tRNA pseudouridine(38-40) synthase TruA [Haliangiales bacterium]|nr:tRNA pseudouridine(38-40) synthase TruA [Haliangiales bacterium]
MTRRIKLTVEYDGTDFEGWQRQAPPHRSVQEALERALADLLGEVCAVAGAGRTDAGVHARAQVASFVTASAIPAAGLMRALNAALPPDVAVRDAEDVDPAFDARRWARGKHYAYRIWNRPERSPLHRRVSWHVRRPLDLDAMRRAAAPLVGEHDFSAFRAAGCTAKSPVRNLRRLDISGEDLIVLDLEATAFLRHMVRNLAGTLVEVGLGARSADEIEAILAGRDRTRAGRTAPPHGLTLERVYY